MRCHEDTIIEHNKNFDYTKILTRLPIPNPIIIHNFLQISPFNSPRQASTQSFGSDSTFAGGEGEAGPPGVKITEIQAAWNVTNAIQGMFIVSLPFAVLRGGYWAIVAMVGVAHICCYTGKVCIDEIKLIKIE